MDETLSSLALHGLLIRFTCFAHVRPGQLLGLGRPSLLREKLDQRRRVGRVLAPQCPTERPPPLREIQAFPLAMHRRTSTRKPAPGVWHQPARTGRALLHDDA
jgi:hypothetical protein